MELVLNKYHQSRNHLSVINELVDEANEIMLAVAFVKASGVDTIIKELKGKKVKILCSLSFLSTEHEALTALLDQGHELRFCNLERGILHTKIWLFKKRDSKKMLIGSANLTGSALVHNFEASVLLNTPENGETVNLAYQYFQYLWDSKSAIVDKMILQNLASIDQKQNAIHNSIKPFAKQPQLTKINEEKLFDFIQSWIDINVNEKIPNYKQSRLWRGWYIVPDQGLINDNIMLVLKKILELMLSNNGILDTKNEILMKSVYQITKETFNSPKKLDYRSLFVRQQKNYLIKFDFAFHPQKDNGKIDTGILHLTDYGIKIAKLKENQIDEYKMIYAKSMDNYEYNGLKIYPFVMKLLQRFGYLDFFEFSSFVKHVYVDDKLELVSDLISIYRNCSMATQQSLTRKYIDYFNKVLEPTAKSVKANYEKSVRQQMSALGWVPLCKYDEANHKLSLN